MKWYRKVLVASFGAILALMIAACGSDSDSPDAHVITFTINTTRVAEVSKTGHLTLRFYGETQKPATVSVFMQDVTGGTEDQEPDLLLQEEEVDGRFQIVEDIIFDEPGKYNLFGEVEIGGKTYRTESDLTVTVLDEKIDVENIVRITMSDHRHDSGQLLVGRTYGLSITWNSDPRAPEPTNTRVIWESNDEAVAVVQSVPGSRNAGDVTITGEGTARLTATSEENPSATNFITVTGVENLEDDRQTITVSTASGGPQMVHGVGNLATDVRFTVEREEQHDEGIEWFAVQFAYDDANITQQVEYSVLGASVDRRPMKAHPDSDGFWLEAGNYTLRLWAPLGEDISVPVRVWVEDVDFSAP